MDLVCVFVGEELCIRGQACVDLVQIIFVDVLKCVIGYSYGSSGMIQGK